MSERGMFDFPGESKKSWRKRAWDVVNPFGNRLRTGVTMSILLTGSLGVSTESGAKVAASLCRGANRVADPFVLDSGCGRLQDIGNGDDIIDIRFGDETQQGANPITTDVEFPPVTTSPDGVVQPPADSSEPFNIRGLQPFGVLRRCGLLLPIYSSDEVVREQQIETSWDEMEAANPDVALPTAAYRLGEITLDLIVRCPAE